MSSRIDPPSHYIHTMKRDRQKKAFFLLLYFFLSPAQSFSVQGGPRLSSSSSDQHRSARRAAAFDEDQQEETPLTSAVEKELGGYDPSERIGEGIKVGDPQIKVKEKDMSVTSILKELAAIQQQGPQKYCILGTRHCSYLHQQIIEML